MFCQNCGKEIPDDAKFCQYCGKEIAEQTSKKEIIEELNKLRYCPKCKKQTSKTSSICEHCGHDISSKNNKQEEPSCLASLISFIGIIIVLFFTIGGCNKKETNTPNQQTSEYTQEQKQNLMKITNDFASEGLKTGFFKKIEKGSDGENCAYIFWTEESYWNNTPYEDKQNARELIRHYSKLRGCYGASFKSYRTGKFL